MNLKALNNPPELKVLPESQPANLLELNVLSSGSLPAHQQAATSNFIPKIVPSPADLLYDRGVLTARMLTTGAVLERFLSFDNKTCVMPEKKLLPSTQIVLDDTAGTLMLNTFKLLEALLPDLVRAPENNLACFCEPLRMLLLWGARDAQSQRNLIQFVENLSSNISTVASYNSALKEVAGYLKHTKPLTGQRALVIGGDRMESGILSALGMSADAIECVNFTAETPFALSPANIPPHLQENLASYQIILMHQVASIGGGARIEGSFFPEATDSYPGIKDRELARLSELYALGNIFADPDGAVLIQTTNGMPQEFPDQRIAAALISQGEHDKVGKLLMSSGRILRALDLFTEAA